MARRRVKLAFIENDSSRRVTYKKRVKDLVKKTQELSVLCGVDVCTIVYGPYDQAPVVWPSSEAEARMIITAFKKKPEIDQCERQLDQETYVKQSLIKAKEKLVKLQRRNREMEMENLISDMFSGKLTLEQVPPTHMGDLLWVIDDKLRSIEHRIKVINDNNQTPISIVNDGESHNVMSPNVGNDNANQPTNPSADDSGNRGIIIPKEDLPINPNPNDGEDHKVIGTNEGNNDNPLINVSANDGGKINVISTNEGPNEEVEEEIQDVKEIITPCKMEDSISDN